MQPGIKAYAKAQSQTFNQRELEASALFKAANRLQALKENWDPSPSVIEEPLANNRKLWIVFLNSLLAPDCPLPQETRSNLVWLARFSINQSMQALLEPAPEKLDILIDINRNIATGLNSNKANPNADTAQPMLSTTAAAF